MKIIVIIGIFGVVVGIIGFICGASISIYKRYRRRAGCSTRQSSD